MFSRTKCNLFNFRCDIKINPFKSHYSKVSPKALKNDWKPVVGLEVHAQLNSKSKLFSGSSTSFGFPVNSNVSLFDAAIPGTLPVLNKKCVELGVLTALSLSCDVNNVSLFDRKHYFYADLPAGYQITQQRAPLAKNGVLNFPVFNPAKHKVPYHSSSKILQFQLEQDSGKSLHDEELQRSLIDLNRAGIPLMEIVFAPDLSDGEEAAALLKELILILTRIDTCSCKMEEGALRVDANISVNRPGEGLGTRTEVKNIGSIRGVANAIDHEIHRQIELISAGERVVNETRSWDAVSGTTVAMRDKEVKQKGELLNSLVDMCHKGNLGVIISIHHHNKTQDYRFMPEPNLPPLRLNASNEIKEGEVNVFSLKNSIPELPEETREIMKTNFGLQQVLILQLVGEEKLLKIFKNVMSNESRDPNITAHLLTIDLMTLVNKKMTSLDSKKFDGDNIGELADLLQKKEINLVTARKVMEEIALGNNHSPSKIVSELGLSQIIDLDELNTICNAVISENPKIVSKYQSGNTKVFSALLGIVAKKTNNRAQMDVVVKIMKEIIEKK